MTLSTRRQGTAGALIAVSIALAACGTGSSDNSKTAAGGGGGGAPTLRTGPGVDASTKTLHVGVLSALSGPAAPLGGPYAAGLKTWMLRRYGARPGCFSRNSWPRPR